MNSGRLRRAARRRILDLTRSTRELGRDSYSRLVDYHIHTRLCGHAVGEPEDYVREAIRKGLAEIGFSDHMPLLHIRDDGLTMAPDELPVYAELIHDVQQSVESIAIRFGIEMDYIPGRMDEIWEAASLYEFDYVYGSIHYLDGWDFGDGRRLSTYAERDPDDMYARYFELFCEAVEKGGFDIMAHPDLVKKHGVWTTLPVDDLYRGAAEALAANDVTVEINSSGLRNKAREIYPALGFLEACVREGVAVTLGSDAHTPRQVGMDFDLVVKHLKRAGVTEIATFQGRKRIMRSI